MSPRHRLIEALRLPVHGRLPIRRSTIVIVVALIALAVLYGSIEPSSSSKSLSSSGITLCSADGKCSKYLPAPSTPTTKAPKTTSTTSPSSTTTVPSTTTSTSTTTPTVQPSTTVPGTTLPRSSTTTTTVPGRPTSTTTTSTSTTSTTTSIP